MDEDLGAMVDAAVDEKAVLHDLADEKYNEVANRLASYFAQVLDDFPHADRRAIRSSFTLINRLRSRAHIAIDQDESPFLPSLDDLDIAQYDVIGDDDEE